MTKFFEIGHEMANVATLVLQLNNEDSPQAGHIAVNTPFACPVTLFHQRSTLLYQSQVWILSEILILQSIAVQISVRMKCPLESGENWAKTLHSWL